MTVSQSRTGANVVRTSSIVVDMSSASETSSAVAVVVEGTDSEDWTVVASTGVSTGASVGSLAP